MVGNNVDVIYFINWVFYISPADTIKIKNNTVSWWSLQKPSKSPSVRILADLLYWRVQSFSAGTARGWDLSSPPNSVLHSPSIHGKVVNFNVLIVYHKAQTVRLASPLPFPFAGLLSFFSQLTSLWGYKYLKNVLHLMLLDSASIFSCLWHAFV